MLPLFGCNTNKYYSMWGSIGSFAAISEIRSLVIAAVVRFDLYSFASVINGLFNWVSRGLYLIRHFISIHQCPVFSHSYRIVTLMDINDELLV